MTEEVKMDNVVFQDNISIEPHYNYRVDIKEFLQQNTKNEGDKIYINENPMLDFNPVEEQRVYYDAKMLEYETPKNMIDIFPHFPREYYPILEEIRDKGKKKYFDDLKVLRKKEKRDKKIRGKKKGKFTITKKNTIVKFN